MKSTRILITGLLALLLATPVLADGGRHGYGHYRHGNGHGYGHYRHGYDRYGHGNHRYGSRYHHRSDRKYGYLAAGIVVGALLNEAWDRRREPERVVVYRTPHRSSPSTHTAGYPRTAPIEDVYYLRESDGSCWLIERTPEGSRVSTPVPPSDCG